MLARITGDFPFISSTLSGESSEEQKKTEEEQKRRRRRSESQWAAKSEKKRPVSVQLGSKVSS